MSILRLVFAIVGVLISVALLVDAILVIALYGYSKDGASWYHNVFLNTMAYISNLKVLSGGNSSFSVHNRYVCS